MCDFKYFLKHGLADHKKVNVLKWLVICVTNLIIKFLKICTRNNFKVATRHETRLKKVFILICYLNSF